MNYKMVSRISLTAIIIMVIGTTSANYYLRWSNFWYQSMLDNKLIVFNEWRQFDQQLYQWFDQRDASANLPASTLATLDALRAFWSKENLDKYGRKELPIIYLQTPKIVIDWGYYETEKRMTTIKERETFLSEKTSEYLEKRKESKEAEREAELLKNSENVNTVAEALAHAAAAKQRAEEARLAAIEVQLDLGRAYCSIFHYDKYQTQALLNTSLLAFITMVEAKLQEKKSEAALKLVPILTNAFKLEVLSRPVLSTAAKEEILDWLEIKIEEIIRARLALPEEGVSESQSSSANSKKYTLKELQSDFTKAEDLEDFLFTLTLLENLPVLFSRAREEDKGIKFTNEASSVFIRSLRARLDTHADLLKNIQLNDIEPQIGTVDKKFEWSNILHKVIQTPLILIRNIRDKWNANADPLENTQLNDIQPQIGNLAKKIEWSTIFKEVTQISFSRSFRVAHDCERAKEMALLVATGRVLDRQDVEKIILDSKEEARLNVRNGESNGLILNKVSLRNPELSETIMPKLNKAFESRIKDFDDIVSHLYLDLFPGLNYSKESFLRHFKNLPESKPKKEFSTEEKTALISVIKEFAGSAIAHYTKSPESLALNQFYFNILIVICLGHRGWIYLPKNDLFDVVKGLVKAKYNLPYSHNLKLILERRLPKFELHLNEYSDGNFNKPLIFAFDLVSLASRSNANSDGREALIALTDHQAGAIAVKTKNMVHRLLDDWDFEKYKKSRVLFETELLNFEENFGLFDELYSVLLKVFAQYWHKSQFSNCDWHLYVDSYLDSNKKTHNYLLFKLLNLMLFPSSEFTTIKIPDLENIGDVVREAAKILGENAESPFSRIVSKIHDKIIEESFSQSLAKPADFAGMLNDFSGKTLKSAWLNDLPEIESLRTRLRGTKPHRLRKLKI